MRIRKTNMAGVKAGFDAFLKGHGITAAQTSGGF